VRFPALFDTNVLYGALLNDCVLSLAELGLFRPLWSAEILLELRRNLLAENERPSLVEKRVATMEEFFPDAMVRGHESLIDEMTNHPKDRHVLAAAVRGGAEVLVTFNLKDFPESSTAPYDIEVVHPDKFLLDQLDLYPGATIRALQEVVSNYDSPAMTMDDYLLALARSGVPKFADEVRDRLD
jgi:predicted nucleic acid-binding protein